jgi:hypothetical protein
MAVSSIIFAETQSTTYPDQQQAWRLLGFFADCSPPQSRRRRQRQRRRGQENEDNNNENEDNNNNNAGDANADAAETDDSSNNNDFYDSGRQCQRYLVWAAYVNRRIPSDSVSAFRIYNGTKWSKCPDKKQGCVALDCHKANTRYELMGIFKVPDYADFLDTSLHSSADGSSLASTLPQNCAQSKKSVFVDLQPGLDLTYQLYSDNICSTDYSKTDSSISNRTELLALVAASADSLEPVNDAISRLYYCQPCLALDSTNQCESFQQNTYTLPATFRDLETAARQGGLVEVQLSRQDRLGVPLHHTGWGNWALTGCAGLAVLLVFVWKRHRRNLRANERIKAMEEPLVTESSF